MPAWCCLREVTRPGRSTSVARSADAIKSSNLCVSERCKNFLRTSARALFPRKAAWILITAAMTAGSVSSLTFFCHPMLIARASRGLEVLGARTSSFFGSECEGVISRLSSILLRPCSCGRLGRPADGNWSGSSAGLLPPQPPPSSPTMTDSSIPHARPYSLRL